MRVFAIAALTLTTACGHAERTEDYDPGGYVQARVVELALMPSRPIEGFCGSACTMRLYRDCVMPDAEFFFHPPTPDSYQARGLMADYYPETIADWFVTMEGERFYTAQQVIAWGARAC